MSGFSLAGLSNPEPFLNANLTRGAKTSSSECDLNHELEVNFFTESRPLDTPATLKCNEYID